MKEPNSFATARAGRDTCRHSDAVGPFVTLALVDATWAACAETSRDSPQPSVMDSGDIAIRQVLPDSAGEQVGGGGASEHQRYAIFLR
jgi:hypothetical protein